MKELYQTIDHYVGLLKVATVARKYAQKKLILVYTDPKKDATKRAVTQILLNHADHAINTATEALGWAEIALKNYIREQEGIMMNGDVAEYTDAVSAKLHLEWRLERLRKAMSEYKQQEVNNG